MSKKKSEISEVLMQAAEICGDVGSLAEMLSSIAKKTKDLIDLVQKIMDTPTKADQLDKNDLPEEEAPKERTYSKVEVRQTLAKVADKNRETVKALLKKYGADNLTTLDPANYAAIMTDAEEALHAE